jgi:hypothetical protein
MAAVTAIVRDFKVLDNPPTIAGLSTARRILLMFAVDNGATQVAGGTDTLDIAVSTLAESRMRGGLSLTPRSWQIIQPAIGASAEYAGTIATSGSGTSLILQITPKTASDWSTNATIAANGATNAPYVVHVLCDVS